MIEIWMKFMPINETKVWYVLHPDKFVWNIVMDDGDLDEESLSKWQFKLQYCKSLVPKAKKINNKKMVEPSSGSVLSYERL